MGLRSLFSALLIFFAGVAHSQTNFRTNQAGGGTWSDPGIWEVETPNGSGTWIPAGSTPTSASNTIVVQAGDIVSIGSDLTIDQATVEINAVLIIDPFVTVIINNGATADDIIFEAGSVLEVNGRLTVNNLAVVTGLDGSAEATFFDGSFYRHLYTITQGALPIAVWYPNSTLEINGYTASTPAPLVFDETGNWSQTFGNVIIDSPIAAGRFINFDGLLFDIQGNLTVTKTAASGTGRVQFAAINNPAAMTIGGDFTISGNGRVYLSQTADLTMDIGGDFNITTANLNSSQFTGGGTTTINLAGDFNMNCFGVTVFMAVTGTGILNLNGDFNLLAGTLSENGTSTGELNFVGTDPDVGQNFNKIGGISQTINYTIAEGTTLNMGVNTATGVGSFTANGNLRVGNITGGTIQNSTATGNIRTPVATRSYAPGITIEYNGAAAQIMGTAFPPDVNVVINNPAGVTLSASSPITIAEGRELIINAGSRLAIAANTLTLDGTVSGTGTISGGGTSNLTIGGSGILGTIAFTTGAQTINTLNINRTSDGEVDLASNLTVTGPLTQTEGDLVLTGITLTVNGVFTQTSGNIVLMNNPSLVIGGSGALPANALFGGDLQLTTLTINRAGATFVTNSNLSIVSQLNLQNGIFNNQGAVAMLTGSTVTRTTGSLSNPLANFGASEPFNIIYNNAGAMASGPEIPNALLDPQNSVLLNNLTKQGSGTLTLTSNVEVNGVFLLNSGSFNAASNIVLIRGNLTSNATSALTNSSAQFGGATVISGSVTPVFGNVTVLSGASVTPNSTFQINGNLVNNGTLNSGTGTTIFGGTTLISGTSTSAFNNLTITGTLTAPSNASILVAGNWVNNGTFNSGVGGTVSFNGNSSIAGTSATNFNHVQITGTLTSPANLNVGGNFIDNGIFVAGTGAVVFNGTAIQNIQGSTATTFNNMNITNTTGGPPGVRIEANKNIRGILTLSPGATFDADGSVNTAVFTMLSTDDDPAVDASIAALTGGAQVLGNVTVQRYMSIEGGSNATFNNGRIYRYISSPVAGAAVSQIQPEIPVTGPFTGRSLCSGCGTTPSMFLYSEPVITDINSSGGNNMEDGYLDFPTVANSETLQTGRGYAIFVRGNLAPVVTNGHARWDVRNPVNSGTINFTPIISYTSSGNNASDGWNLVGNPYPSTIDWNAASGWTKTGLDNSVYMRDNGSNPIVYATFNGIVGTNGGSRYIPMGQAFFVKSNGGPLNFQATEDVKAPGNPSIFFREAQPSNVLRIALRQGATRDESVIHLREDAAVGFDTNDAYKLRNGAFNLSTMLADGTKVAINSFASIDCGKVVKLDVSDVTAGSYQLDFSDFESFDIDLRITLRDAFTGANINVEETPSYTFMVTTDTKSFGQERFSLILSPSPIADMAVAAPSAICAKEDVKIIIAGSDKGYSYAVSLDNIEITKSNGTGKTLEITIPHQQLKNGLNLLKIEGQSLACSDVKVQSQSSVLVEELQQAAINVVDENTLASNYETGNSWYLNGRLIEGATGQYLHVAESGVYKLSVESGSCTSSADRELMVTEVVNGVSLYPNPVKRGDILTVRTTDANITEVSITNSTGVEIGEVVMEKKEYATSTEFVGHFDLNKFPSGLYLIKIKDGNKFRIVKIISL